MTVSGGTVNTTGQGGNGVYSYGSSTVSMTLDASSTWVVTGTSYLTSLTNANSTNSNITCQTSGRKVYLNGTAWSLWRR